MKKPGQAYYMISAVAQKYNIHPQTLRLYEREGLLKPSRTEGNTRLYSEEDRRANRLGVSRRGKAKYEQARDTALTLQVDVLKVLPEENREIFLEQLETIARACALAAAEAAERKLPN